MKLLIQLACITSCDGDDHVMWLWSVTGEGSETIAVQAPGTKGFKTPAAALESATLTLRAMKVM